MYHLIPQVYLKFEYGTDDRPTNDRPHYGSDFA